MPRDRLVEVKAALKRVHLWRTHCQARLRAAARGKRLAPGRLQMLPAGSLADQLFFTKEAQKYGPVFKVWWTNKLTTCIVGHDLGRRFLSANEGRIRAATVDLTPLFPHGFLRAMEGETHRKYRRIFIDAFRLTPLEDHRAEIRSIIDEALGSIAREEVSNAEHLRTMLKNATTAISLRLILGIDRLSPRFAELAAAYDAYAPDAPFLVVQKRHKTAYAILNQQVAELAEAQETLESPPSLLKALVAAGQIDETVTGNLIQLTDTSLHDMQGLWFWILHMLSVEPRILEMADAQAGVGRDLAMAIAQEALRMEQSEFIHRVASDDITFNGYFIPKNSRIRICVWDGHRDPVKFPYPSRFDPKRFIGRKPEIDSYSPFGLDKHRCLGADWTIELAAAFVERLLNGYKLDLVRTGPSERGRFHFQPSSKFELKLRPAGRA
jgi:cytochrome P450